jgi:hypothetical protein
VLKTELFVVYVFDVDLGLNRNTSIISSGNSWELYCCLWKSCQIGYPATSRAGSEILSFGCSNGIDDTFVMFLQISS